jgi:hypothetical protein
MRTSWKGELGRKPKVNNGRRVTGKVFGYIASLGFSFLVWTTSSARTTCTESMLWLHRLPERNCARRCEYSLTIGW